MEEDWSVLKMLTGKPRGKRPLESPKRRWEDIVRLDIKEIGANMRNWIYSVQDKDYWRTL